MMGMVTQICPKTYSGSSATRQNTQQAPVAQHRAVAVQRADEESECPAPGRASP